MALYIVLPSMFDGKPSTQPDGGEELARRKDVVVRRDLKERGAKCKPMNKNQIRGIRRRASWQLTTKPISIKDAGCESGGCAPKAVELTSGDLLRVVEPRLL